MLVESHFLSIFLDACCLSAGVWSLSVFTSKCEKNKTSKQTLLYIVYIEVRLLQLI